MTGDRPNRNRAWWRTFGKRKVDRARVVRQRQGGEIAARKPAAENISELQRHPGLFEEKDAATAGDVAVVLEIAHVLVEHLADEPVPLQKHQRPPRDPGLLERHLPRQPARLPIPAKPRFGIQCFGLGRGTAKLVQPCLILAHPGGSGSAAPALTPGFRSFHRRDQRFDRRRVATQPLFLPIPVFLDQLPQLDLGFGHGRGPQPAGDARRYQDNQCQEHRNGPCRGHAHGLELCAPMLPLGAAQSSVTLAAILERDVMDS
jgi:hypothetical protein